MVIARARVAAYFTAFVLAIVQAAAQSDPPPLTSNRPGIGDSEALVPRGAFQLEAGMQAQDAPPGSDRGWTETFGQVTMRVGLTRRVEVYGGWDGVSLDRVRIDGESHIVTGRGRQRTQAVRRRRPGHPACRDR
jgi:hypothetical protein